MQQFLKPPRRAARAGILAAQLLAQLLVAVDDAIATLDACFRRETAATLTGDLDAESSRGGCLRAS